MQRVKIYRLLEVGTGRVFEGTMEQITLDSGYSRNQLTDFKNGVHKDRCVMECLGNKVPDKEENKEKKVVRRTRRKNKEKDIDVDLKAAQAAGMSYGMYKAMQMMEGRG